MVGKRVGVLALQGDVSLHAQLLDSLTAEVKLVKLPVDLKNLDGLVIPGGESTALLRLAEPIGILPAILEFAKKGNGIFGTCAGAILLAKKVTNPAQQSLGLIEIEIERNGYGRQVDSFEGVGKLHPPLGKSEILMTFIRAPRITKTGPKVQVIATHKDEPVCVQQSNILACTFHPELTNSQTIYKYWLNQV